MKDFEIHLILTFSKCAMEWQRREEVYLRIKKQIRCFNFKNALGANSEEYGTVSSIATVISGHFIVEPLLGLRRCTTNFLLVI